LTILFGSGFAGLGYRKNKEVTTMKQIKKSFFLLALFTGLFALAAGEAAAQFRTNTSSSSSRGGSSTRADSYSPGRAWEAIIEVDPDTKSLIVIADEETNEQIKKIIEHLDRPVLQVLIKVLFLEVTHNDDFDLGIEGSFTHGRSNPNTLQSFFGLSGETRGGFYRILEDDLEVTMRAISEVGSLEVLSRPSIMTRNNEEATITVGQEVPFINNSRVTSDGQVINTVIYEDIGIILRVTPYITEDGKVEMDLSPEISTLTGDTVPISDTINSPVFAKRSADTRVVIPDGKTVVIGGMIEDNKTESVRKVPLLGDIPLLGMAFRRTVKTNSKTELLIFLTPHIVEGEAQLIEMSEFEKNGMELAPKVFTDEQMGKFFKIQTKRDAGVESAEAEPVHQKQAEIMVEKSKTTSRSKWDRQRRK